MVRRMRGVQQGSAPVGDGLPEWRTSDRSGDRPTAWAV